jgi:hypothetical protein
LARLQSTLGHCVLQNKGICLLELFALVVGSTVDPNLMAPPPHVYGSS